MDTVPTLDWNSHRPAPMSGRATDYSPCGNAVCAREAHQYIITHLPAFVNLACLKITLTITIDRKVDGLRETHTHDYFLAPLLILSNGHYWIRTNDLLDVNEML